MKDENNNVSFYPRDSVPFNFNGVEWKVRVGQVENAEAVEILAGETDGPESRVNELDEKLINGEFAVVSSEYFERMPSEQELLFKQLLTERIVEFVEDDDEVKRYRFSDTYRVVGKDDLQITCPQTPAT